MEPPARKVYHRMNMKLYNEAKLAYEALYDNSTTPEHYGLEPCRKTRIQLQIIQQMLKTIEEAFEARPNAVASGFRYLREDDLDIRHRLKIIDQKIRSYDGWRWEGKGNI